MIRKLFSLAAGASLMLAASHFSSAEDACPVVGEACPAECFRKSCCPTVEKKTVVKRVYTDTCEDFCLPRITLAAFCDNLFRGWLPGCQPGCAPGCEPACDGEPCVSCQHLPRIRKILVVKLRKHEECIEKCKVTQEIVPACPKPCYGRSCPAPVGCVLPLGGRGVSTAAPLEQLAPLVESRPMPPQ